MPRPARSISVRKRYARRRHRSWMLSMCLASVGWATWWVMLLIERVAPNHLPGLFWPSLVSTVFASLGLLLALLTVRARRSWLLFTLVPLFANTSLLFVPWLAAEVARRVAAAGTAG